ncbi:MAG: hypothetical protein AAF327_03840 [Cyanobacteria bacterium P01_A01_bin.37]
MGNRNHGRWAKAVFPYVVPQVISHRYGCANDVYRINNPASRFLIEVLIAEEFRVCGFPDPEEFTKTALNTGRLLGLFDGLDEVPNQRLNRVIESIRNVVDRHHKN